MTDPREQELQALRRRVETLEAQIRALGHEPVSHNDKIRDSKTETNDLTVEAPQLQLDEYVRYGRQMILPNFGLPSQLALCQSSILVVGAGGLGCPALMYLVAAGIGMITIVDHDSVELSNLHRQVLHGVDMIGRPKVESAKQALLRINPSVKIVTHCISLTSATLSTVFSSNVRFHAVLDCTDTPSTRYLLSDITALLGIPLISGAAQRTDGQLVIYNLPPSSTPSLTNRNTMANSASDNQKADSAGTMGCSGPCMRCVFPSVSRTGAGAERCSDVGVLGPVVGVIGVLMALETIKVLTGFGQDECQLHTPSMLLFTSLSPRPFKTIKLRPRQPSCPGCSQPASTNLSQGQSITQFLGDTSSLEDSYNEFCGLGSHEPEDPVLTGARSGRQGTRVRASNFYTRSVQVLKEAFAAASVDPKSSVMVIDTRPPTEFGICAIPGSTNIPLAQILKTPGNYISKSARTFVVCRLGNDSQIAARALRDALHAAEPTGAENLAAGRGDTSRELWTEDACPIVDVIGGLRAWAREVDPSFPIY